MNSPELVIVLHSMAAHETWVIIHGGPARDPWALSGIPDGLADGLSQFVATHRVSTDLPRLIRRFPRLISSVPGYSIHGHDAAPVIYAKDLLLRRSDLVRTADTVISLGSEYGYRLGSREGQFRVLYEDMTVAQSPYPPGPAKDRWIRRQAALYEQTDLCCVATPWAAESLQRDYGVPETKIEVLGFGANVVCSPNPGDWANPRYLWVGVDWHRKGGDVLLDAWRLADMPGATLDLVGRHPSHDLPSGVTGHGVVRDRTRLRRFFEEATVFVMPSRFEAAGIVFVEAASAGTPCIGTSVGGLPYMLGPSGLIVPPGEVEPLVTALRSMADPEVGSRFVAPALDHSAKFTWAAVAERMFRAITDRSRTGIR
jgi:glycosyltransferase involved in cell wall biosynthesis